jgi:hypothetical protein
MSAQIEALSPLARFICCWPWTFSPWPGMISPRRTLKSPPVIVTDVYSAHQIGVPAVPAVGADVMLPP